MKMSAMLQGDVLTRMVEHKIAVGIHKFASEEEILSAILTVRDDLSFRQNVQRMSALFRNRRSSAMEEAMGLLQYVAETKGANHLKVIKANLFLKRTSVEMRYKCF